ncbi:Uncharacterized protein OBRU01_04396 [Operophtera brumata]|uniref:Uncharacterized protein n=1 Tax=Operophtera brumata TaxID=104452 RepID=A0A0L7LPC4_OPEBR|nr:Uncharacterized protein OBRU01_04396 [Operophtera brumata]
MLAFILSSAGLIMSTNGEVDNSPGQLENSSHPDKDMGSQESVTFFQTNGTHLDLSGIPKPLLTNVTAQSMVGVGPVANNVNKISGPWSTSLGQLASLPNTISMDRSEKANNGEVTFLDSSGFHRRLFRRDITGNSPVKVIKGTAVIPPTVGLQSISLPLLSLNNKLSGIPVPIPNTAVVNYAKVNTLVRGVHEY